MSAFVIDASVTLSWCFEDEAGAGTDRLLDRLNGGDQVWVPAHWPVEISNGMLMALRRKRIPPGHFELFWDLLANLPITVEPPLSPDSSKVILGFCERHALTFYDAAYLELAKRKGLSLATLDSALVNATPQEGVGLLALSQNGGSRNRSIPPCLLGLAHFGKSNRTEAEYSAD
jgi:predicted nucleic acid-binding protein